MESLAVNPSASDCLGYFANKLSVDSDSLVKKIYANALLDKDSMAASHLTSVVMDAMKNEMNKYARNTMRTMTVPQSLTTVEQEALKTMYPEYSLNFSNNIYESHNFAHASRTIETVLCMNKLAYFTNYKIRKRSIILKDIGGNRVFHALRGHTSVHVCAPVLSHTDAHRRATSDWRLNTAVVSDKDQFRHSAVQLFRRPSTHYCNNIGQKCCVKAPTLMFIHSIYDMTPTDVADSMAAADATVATGTYIYDPRILMYDTGRLPLLNVMWKKYVKNGIKYIDFTFVGDAQPVYTHSLSVYLSYLETTYIVDTSKKFFYTFQFNENRNGIQFFTVTRIDATYVPKSNIKINHTLLGQDNFLLVTYYEWLENVSIGSVGRMRKIKLLVPTTLWEQAYDMLKQQSDGSFTIAKAMEFMICYNKKTIINGQTVSHHQKCSSQVLDKLAYALYVRVYIDKYLASSALTAVLDDINNVRELTKMGPIRAMYTIFKEKFKSFFFPTMETENLLAPYCAWATLSKLYKYPVDVVDAVSFHTVDAVLPEIIQLNKMNKDFGAIQEMLSDVEVPITPIAYVEMDSVTSKMPETNVISDTNDQMFAGLMGNMPSSCTRTDGDITSVPGDGHCFFHSTIVHFNENGFKPTRPELMRARVNEELRSNEIFVTLDAALKSDISQQLVGGNGAQPVCIFVCKAVAIVYKFNLCVHFHKNDIFDHSENYNFDQSYLTFHYHFNIFGDGNVGHFQPILYEKICECTSNITCDADLQLIRDRCIDEVDEFMAALEIYDGQTINDAKNRMQDCDVLHPYVCSDVLPIISIVDQMNYNLKDMRTLDICSSPGSVSQYFVQNDVRIVVALTDDIGKQRFFDDKVTQNYLDITDLDVSLEFTKLHSNNLFDMIVADGCTGNDGYEYNRNLFLCELVIAMSLLSDTGNMIIRSWRYKYAEQNTIIEILQLNFADVRILRPYPMHLTDGVNYIVCTNYKRPGDIKHVQTFIGMLIGNVMNSQKLCDVVLNDIQDHRNALETLWAFIRNAGLNTNDVVTKNEFVKLIPDVNVDDDVYGGHLPDLRTVKLTLLSTVLQAYLYELEGTVYPFLHKSILLKNLGIVDNVKLMIDNAHVFPKNVGVYCRNLTVKNVADLKIVTRMKYDINDKYISFKCETCKIDQFIPRINGFFACRCDVRNKLYLLVDDLVTCQSIIPYTCNNIIRNGAIITATMTQEDAVYEYELRRQLDNDIRSWEQTRIQLNSQYQKMSMQLMDKINGELVSAMSDKSDGEITDSVDVADRNDVCDQNNTIADAMINTIDTVVDKPDIQEDTLPDDGTMIMRLKKAFHECYNIWKLTDYNHTVTLKRVLEMVKETKPSKELDMYLTNADSEPYVRINGCWYPSKPKDEYMYEYDGSNYRPYNVSGDTCAVVSEYTKKKFEPTFIQKCDVYYKNLFNNVVKTKFELVSGVPGCGKTTYIMKNHKKGDLVLSATKEGAREFRKRAMEAGETDVKRNYRTVYSYLYNSHDKYDTVYVDEAMMMHPGMMYAISCGTKCRRLVMVGDVRQIPYYVRIDYDASYHKFDSVFKVTSYLHVSYRCPQDVAGMMRGYYDKFDSASKVVKSMNAVYVSGKNDVPTGYDIYLTFSQSDKETLLTMYDNVNTVHEYQGKQAKRVALYRGSPTMLKLYESVEHHIVALTRHTNIMTYFTVVQDGLYNAITKVKGGALATVGVQYVATSLFASNKYSIFHFTSRDMMMKHGIDVDIGSRTANLPVVTVSKYIGGLKYVYDRSNNRYVFHLLTHDRYYNAPDYRYIKQALYLLKITLADLRITSLHGSFNYTGNWYDVENLLDEIGCTVVVHDPKGKYDRYRLADVIVDYHHEQTGPNLNDINDTRLRDLETTTFKVAVMPDVYVLVYTDVYDADVDLQKKFHYVPISMYTSASKRVFGSRIYLNYCVLLSKSAFKADSHLYDCKKFFSASLMRRSFNNVLDNLEILQQFNDMVLPNAYGIDTSMDVLLVAQADVTYHVQDCSFNAASIHNPIKTFNCVRPKLKTAMCPPRPTNSLKEVLKAVEKRNCAVPKIQLSMDVYAKAIELYKKFLKYMCIDDTQMETINYNKDLVEEWLTTQDNNIVNMVQKTSISDMALNKYSLTIKKNSKPLLDMACVNTYAALQTVVFSSKDFNTYFCPIFRQFKKNMMGKLVDKILLMADMPPHRFAQMVTKQLAGCDMNEIYSLEFDVSKYDKSQALVHLLVDCFILRHFGVSDLDVNRWFVGHVFTVLRDPSTRLTAYNYFQRKSGDPSTWILNTVQVLVMIVNVIDVSQWDSIALILASGDDSEIVSMERLRINQKKFADVFNYEVKIYDNFRSVYFCSKFVIFDSNCDVYIVPDIYKMIKKLGRHDLKNRDHLVSYRRSVLDGLRDFIVPERVKIEYVTALSERYKCGSFSYDTVVGALYRATISDDDFERLYDKNDSYYMRGFGIASDL